MKFSKNSDKIHISVGSVGKALNLRENLQIKMIFYSTRVRVADLEEKFSQNVF